MVKQIAKTEEKNGDKEPAEDHSFREKDLKGHIKSPNEKTEKTTKNEGEKKTEDNLDNDNQLKSAIDILKGLIILTEKK